MEIGIGGGAVEGMVLADCSANVRLSESEVELAGWKERSESDW